MVIFPHVILVTLADDSMLDLVVISTKGYGGCFVNFPVLMIKIIEIHTGLRCYTLWSHDKIFPLNREKTILKILIFRPWENRPYI